MFLRSKFFIDTTLQPFQSLINVVDHRSNSIDPNSIDPTLKMKENLKLNYQCCTILKQCQCPVLKQRYINVAQRQCNRFSTLHRVVSTLFQRDLIFSYSYIKTNLASEKHGLAEN